MGTYLCLAIILKSVIEKRYMAQHNYVAVGQEYDRCPRMRSRTPVIFDLPGQGEKVIIIKNGFSSKISSFPRESE
jgi:hypothetical protein